MTKTLTEQWREGTLSLNYYYIKLQSGKYGIDHTVMSIDGDLPKTKFAYSNFAIEEVLASVPTYAEFKDLMSNLIYIDKYRELLIKNEKLEKQIEIATKALKETKEKLLHVELSGLDGDNRQKMYDLMFEDGVIDKALKEMEGVK